MRTSLFPMFLGSTLFVAGCGEDNNLGGNNSFGDAETSGDSDAPSSTGAEGADEASDTASEATDSANDAGDGDGDADTSADGNGDGDAGGDGDTGGDGDGSGTTGDGDGDSTGDGDGDGDGDTSGGTGEVDPFPPGPAPGNSEFNLWYEALHVNGCPLQQGGVTLEAPWGFGTGITNNSGADFDAGIIELRLAVNAFSYPELLLDLDFVEPTPQFETVADGGYGGVSMAFDPALHPVDDAICDYCNAGGEVHLEANFVVDGMTIGWYDSFTSQITCN